MFSDAMHYPLSMRILHWLIGFAIIALIAVGLYMGGLEDNDPNRGALYTLHKATGFTVLYLVAIRVIVRLKSILPPLPAGISHREGQLAHGVHMLLYVMMFVMPLSGVMMSNAFGHGIDYYGLFFIPPFIAENREIGGIAHEIHEYGWWVLAGLLVLHIAGVIKHRFVDKHDVLHRMTGGKPPHH